MKAEKGNAPAGATAEASIDKQIQSTKGNVQMNNSSIIQNRVDTVQFHGAALYVININDAPFVAVKPVCEAIGVDAEAQRLRIMRHPVLSSCAFVTKVQLAGDTQKRDVTCIPLEKLNGFLFGINANRIKDAQIKAKLIEYQSECFDVLADYWQKGYAINPRPFKQGRDDVLTVEEANLLRQTLENDAEMLYPDNPEKRGAFIRQGWSKLKSHFGVSYKQIPRFELTAAVSILARHGTEWGMKHERPVTVMEFIKNGMDSIRAMICIDMRTGERQIVALKETERIVDLGSEDRVRALVHDLNHSYYPTILKTIQQHYIEVEQAYYSRQRRANDMPACAQPI